MEWISVKDKLPEFEQDVLLCVVRTEKDKYILVGSLSSLIQGKSYKNPEFRDEKYEIINAEISHWQPLPELP